jgi:DNA-binding CsgD family transcriptional regulator
MEEFIELGELFLHLSGTSSVAVVITIISQYAGRFGLTGLSLFNATIASGDFCAAALPAEASRRDQRKLKNLGEFFGHPAVERARFHTDPFPISSLPHASAIGLMRALSPDDINSASADGLVVPIHDGSELVAVAVFIGQKPEVSPLARDALKLAAKAGICRIAQLDAETGQTKDASLSSLTPRELECLRYIASGSSDAEVAKHLSISLRTVRFHIDNAKFKMNASTRVQAVAKLLRHHPAARLPLLPDVG